MQSGGIGFAMVDHLTRLGIGISSFASVGNKLDVSSNDMLMWWEQDGQTRVAVLYIESFGNPRKFGRTARRVGLKMPVLTVHAGRSEAGQRAAASHTAARRHPAGHQGGAVRAGGDHRHAELRRADGRHGAARHPAAARGPDGRDRVQRRRRRRARRRRLHRPRARRPPSGRADQAAAARARPGRRRGQRAGRHRRATVSADAFRQVLETLGADAGVHAVIALILRTGATGDLLSAPSREADLGVPLAVVVLNQPEAVRLVDAADGKAPSYAYPETAARALSRAVKYAEWRAAPRRTVPAFPDVDAERAREIVHAFLAATARRRLAAARRRGRAAAGLPDPPRSPPRPPGPRDDTELVVGVREDQMFGSLVVLGLGGTAAQVPADYAARLTPLTEADADTLIGSVRSAPMVHGHLSDPAADVGALRDLLLRVSRLADDLPEVTELDLYPVIARPGSAVAVDARIRVASEVPADPFLRRLR